MNTRNKVKIMKKKKKKHQKKYLDEIKRESWRQCEEDDVSASDDPSSSENENTRKYKLQSQKGIEAESFPVENTVGPKPEITEMWGKYWNEYGGWTAGVAGRHRLSEQAWLSRVAAALHTLMSWCR